LLLFEFVLEFDDDMQSGVLLVCLAVDDFLCIRCCRGTKEKPPQAHSIKIKAVRKGFSLSVIVFNQDLEPIRYTTTMADELN